MAVESVARSAAGMRAQAKRHAYLLILLVAPLCAFEAFFIWRTGFPTDPPGPQGEGVIADSLLAFAVIGLFALFCFGRWKKMCITPLRLAQNVVEASELRYRTLLEETADLILLLREGAPKRRIAYLEKDFLGHDPATLEDLPATDWIHPDDLGAASRHLRSLTRDKPRTTITTRLKHKNGTYIWTEATLCRIEQADGGLETVITVRDISERHREAEELRQAILAARCAESEADEANKAKTEFLACMSHEIRTPLNSVIGFAGLLLGMQELDPQVRLYSERIQAGGNALLTVVNDILDFSQVEAGVVDLKPVSFSVPHLIEECRSLVQQSALAKRMSLHVHLMDRLPPAVIGDQARIRQILLNLLNNAIKFTDEGSVLLDIRYDRTSGATDRIKFSVIDTGIGIAADDLPRLFQRFAQVDSSIRRIYGGSGLGLVISRRLVELMGGEIGVESEKGVGSTFWFVLPLSPTEVSAPAASPAIPSPVAPSNILLVEDVPLNQDLVRHILEASGHRVDVVSNGTEAIMAVEDMDYDLVLMDIQMPYLDGLSATRQIRELSRRSRDVPIVAMTANVLPEQTATAMAAGMVDVIHKPFSAAQIYAMLDRVIGSKKVAAATQSPIEMLSRPDTLTRLAGLIGDTKVKDLLASLANSLTARFDADATTPESRELLKRQAHASVAGSGMLGFTDFATSCKRLEMAADPDDFSAHLAMFKSEAASVIAQARLLSAQPGSLAGRPGSRPAVVRLQDLAGS